MKAILSLLLFCSIPTDPIPAIVHTGVIQFDRIDHKSAMSFSGQQETFKIVLASESDIWFGCRCFEVQMKGWMYGTVWLKPDEDENGEDELIVTGRLRIIPQTDMKGLPFLEYRIEGARIVKK